VKWRWQTPEVDELYRYAQERSRLLRGQGSSLVRADIERLRTEAGERPWSAVAMEPRGEPAPASLAAD
jgi:hypothetical protein